MSTPFFALFVHDISNNYQLLMREDARATARSLGHTVVVHSAERSSDVQLAQIRAVLAEPAERRPAALFVSPVRESGLIGAARESLGKGVAWVLLCRTSDALALLRKEFPKVPAFSVAADQTAIGRLQGKQIAALLRPDDEIVYIQGPSGTSSAERRASATRQELHSRSTRWSIFNADWSVDGGAKAMSEWLRLVSRRSPLPPFLLVGQNDNMAVGARRAIIDAGLSPGRDVPRVVGVDGVPTFGHRMVATGELTATVVVPSVAGKAIQTYLSSARQGQPPPAEVLMDVSSHPPLDVLERRPAPPPPKR